MLNVIEILRNLIQIDSSNPPGNEKHMVDYILTYFPGYKNTKVITHDEKRASLVIDIPGITNQVLAFVGHLDTVPVDISKWTYNPFSAEIVNNAMYGRGTSDMKSGLACMICAASYFINNAIRPKYTIRLVFTADEECNGTGIKYLINEGFFEDVDFLILPEPTDEAIVLKEKGSLWLRFLVHGKSSHGSQPELGINAIEKLYELIEHIKPIILTGEMDSLLGKSSLAINKIQGGKRVNITADFCEAEVDIRTLPSLNHGYILDYIDDQIKKIEEKNKGLNIALEILNNRPPLMTEEKNELVVELVKTMENLGLSVEFKGVNYFTDASLVLSKYDIPFIIYGPGKINQCHIENEYVLLSAVRRVLNVYLELLRPKN